MDDISSRIKAILRRHYGTRRYWRRFLTFMFSQRRVLRQQMLFRSEHFSIWLTKIWLSMMLTFCFGHILHKSLSSWSLLRFISLGGFPSMNFNLMLIDGQWSPNGGPLPWPAANEGMTQCFGIVTICSVFRYLNEAKVTIIYVTGILQQAKCSAVGGSSSLKLHKSSSSVLGCTSYLFFETGVEVEYSVFNVSDDWGCTSWREELKRRVPEERVFARPGTWKLGISSLISWLFSLESRRGGKGNKFLVC